MPIKDPGTKAVLATGYYPYKPSRPCRNTIIRVIFSDEGIEKGEI
jgi:hypothetical protein